MRKTIENSKSGDCSWISRVYDWPFGRDECKPDYTADKAAIINAYLAEHPVDDDEAIDEEWLRSVGFVLIEEPEEVPDGRYRHTGTWLDVWDMNGDGWIVNAFDQAGIKPNMFTTRGQLRRLIASLTEPTT